MLTCKKFIHILRISRLLLPLTVLSLAALVPACDRAHGAAVPAGGGTALPPPAGFAAYYYQGQAELNSYHLHQARYGEMREGEAVLVYVAEDFSTETLTKYDGKGEKVPVLKLNFDKKFRTGVYPYSMFMTVATPVDYGTFPAAMKLACSSQEWCGTTYSQLNLRGKQYELTEHSYFPQEGDRTEKLDAVLLEDEVWVRLRIHPESLPEGDVRLIPGSFQSRLRHVPLAVETAQARYADVEGMPGVRSYTLRYGNGTRTLSIQYRKDWPHEIEGWTETYQDGFGDKAKMLTTTATRIKTLKSDYWNHNALADSVLYRELMGH